MTTVEMLLALLNPNLPSMLLNTIMGFINLVCIVGGITLLAYLLKSLKQGKSTVAVKPTNRKLSAKYFLLAIAVTTVLIWLYVVAGVKLQTDTAEPGSYSP